MFRVLLVVLVILPFKAVVADPINPLHYLSADWGLDEFDNSTFRFSGLHYGFQQADLVAEPPETGHVLGLSHCSVRTSLFSYTVDPIIDLATGGDCVDENEWPLLMNGELTFLIPGGSPDAAFADEREVAVNSPVLAAEANAVSTSMGIFGGVTGSSNFKRSGFFQSFVTEKSKNAQASDLAGDWAFTRLELEVSPNPIVPEASTANYTVLTFAAEIRAGEGASLFAPAGTEFIESEFFHNLDGSGVEKRRFETTSEDEDLESPFLLDPDGQVFWSTGNRGQPGRNPQIFGGFIAPTADFLVLAEGVPGILPLRSGEPTPPEIVDEFSAHQLFVGIKRNNNPKLQGRKYQLVGLKFHPNAGSFELATWTERTRLHFQGKSRGTWRIDTMGKRVALGNSDQAGVTAFGQNDKVRFNYTVEDDGRIFLDLAAIEGLEQDLVNGYASADNRVLLFSHALSLDEKERGEIGMFIGLCTNCDEDEGD